MTDNCGDDDDDDGVLDCYCHCHWSAGYEGGHSFALCIAQI